MFFTPLFKSLDVVVSAFCMQKAGGKNILICLSVQRKAVPLQSRLLSKVYKELILSVLIVLCPGTVRNAGKNCFLVVNI